MILLKTLRNAAQADLASTSATLHYYVGELEARIIRNRILLVAAVTIGFVIGYFARRI